MAGGIMADSSKIPEGFTLPMAVMDALPVVFFAIGAGHIAANFDSRLFAAGVFLVVIAGVLKVAWKFVLALAHKDIALLNHQMCALMPIGFAMMIVGLVADRALWSPAWVLHAVTAVPSLYFLVVGIVGIIFMVSFAIHADSRDARTNWREQTVNAVAQFCIMMAIVLV